MLDAALEALKLMSEPATLVYLGFGVLLGTLTGLLPGLGGSVGMALLLPFIYGVEPHLAVAMLIGIMAVNNTSDTFSSILLGIPGSSSSQATIMDGYPLTRKGEGARALGAALFGSMVGGIIGAIALVLIIPIARPLILSLGSPELFMLTLLGLSIVGILAGDKPLAGLLTASIGLLLGMVGSSVATTRFVVFEWDYLRQGISLVILIMGLYAIPELLQLLEERAPIARSGKLVAGGLLRGIRDVVRHRLLVIGASLGAVMAAIVPGITGTAVSWSIYSLTKRFSRHNENFGKGDIRGVIAPDSANNAMEGGALVPTMLFGIPAGASGAVLLGGMILVGINPGSSMLQAGNLPILLVMAFSLAAANIIATSMCLSGARVFAKLSTVRPGLLVPAIFIVVVVACFQQSNQWHDIGLLLALAVVGMCLARAGWPRPPLLIGFVLGPNMENYLRLSVDRYDFTWLRHPAVIGIGSVTALLFVAATVLGFRQSRQQRVSVGRKAVAVMAGAPASTTGTETVVGLAAADPEALSGGLRHAPLPYWIAWGLALFAISTVVGLPIGAAIWLTAFLAWEIRLRWVGLVAYLAGYAGLIYVITHFAGAEMPPPLFGPFAR